MSRILKNKIALVFIILGISVQFAYFGCSSDENEKPKKRISTPEFPDQEGWNSTVISTKNGVRNAIIRYGHMQRFKKRKIVEFDDGIEIDFYNDEGEHTSKLKSERGRLKESTNDIEAIENVVVVSDSGITLQTERLWWDNSIEKVVTDKFVTITTVENDTLYGYGFESDQYLKNWQIKNVSGKAGRGFDLNFKMSKEEQKTDSVSSDSQIIKNDSLSNGE